MDALSRRTSFDRVGHGVTEKAPAVASMSALIEQLTGFARRQFYVLLIVPVVAVGLGLAYLAVTPSQYTAAATLLIDVNALKALQNQQQPVGDTALDSSQVGSQVEILRSEKIALAVIRELKLTEDPQFVSSGRGPFALVARLFSQSGSGLDATAEKERKALEVFISSRNITRVERTYALEIAFTSYNPVDAARIANAIADAYIDDQLNAKYQTIRRASSWLQDRISELKAQAASADQAVLAFKEKNNIVDFGGTGGTPTPGASSRLIGEQQLFELNSQLSAARGATNEARARLERIEQVRKLDASEAAVSDTLHNDVITRLRNQYLDLSAREGNWSNRYGKEHQATINLREQMEEVRRNIRDELSRIAASYQSDFEIARSREENLEKSIAAQISEGQVTNRDRLGLSELESAAKSYHTIHDLFMQRYTEAIQQQSFPITDARVISSAAPPSHRSKPVGSLVLAIATSLGMILGLGIASLREAVDGVFRSSRQVEQRLGLRCLSVIPLAEPKVGVVGAGVPPLARRLNPRGGSWREPTEKRLVAAMSQTDWPVITDPLMRRVVDEPLSAFTEAFRAIKVSIEIRATMQINKVIGITSTLPNEGKSTVACNLASLMADAGRRVILVDADLRNPTLIRVLDPKPAAGLLELLTGKADLQQAIGRERDTGLAFLPLLLNEQVAHFDEILSSQAFRDLIDRLRESYDFVIMDLPPIAPVVDVRTTLPVIDSLVFVVEWAGTKINAVERHLVEEPELYDRVLGVVLNKANLKVLQRFDQYGSYGEGYYASRSTAQR